MSRVTITRDNSRPSIRIEAEIDEQDLANLNLDQFDRMVVDSEVKEPADILQSAEIIFRRMRQQGIV